MQTFSRKHIAALDGLRATAIIAVLIYHFDSRYLAGGFIGVDIFFVISGYIITLNIIRELSEGSFRLATFYKKRVARLFPALAVTVVVSLAVAFLIFGAERVNDLSISGVAALFSFANIFFWLHSGYFDPLSQNNLFLHTWSLSVEEQFYLLWPIGLALAFNRRLLSPSVLAAISIVTLIFSAVLFSTHQSAAFYLMPARVFQFSIGALIAVSHFRRLEFFTLGTAKKKSLYGFALAGLALITSSALFSNGRDYSYIIAAIVPTIGAGSLIVAINSPFAQIVLGNRPCRFVGKRAYSLYLVHWPIVVCATVYLGTFRSLGENIALITITFVLAEILMRCVEIPLRIKPSQDRKNSLRVRAVGVVFAGSILITSTVYLVSSRDMRNEAAMAAKSEDEPHMVVPDSNDVLDSRSTRDTSAIPNARKNVDSFVEYAKLLMNDRSKTGRGHRGCQLQQKKSIESFNQAACMPDTDSKPKLMVLADSYGAETIVMLEQTYRSEDIISASGAGCLPLYPEKGDVNRGEGCIELNKRRFEWVSQRNDIVAVALASNWARWRDDDIRSTLDYLTALPLTVVMFGARPVFSEHIPTLLDSSAGKSVGNSLNRYFTTDSFETNDKLKEIAAEYGDGVIFIDLLPKLCPDQCSAFSENGDLIYLDIAHISVDFAREMGIYIREFLPNVSDFEVKK